MGVCWIGVLLFPHKKQTWPPDDVQNAKLKGEKSDGLIIYGKI